VPTPRKRPPDAEARKKPPPRRIARASGLTPAPPAPKGNTRAVTNGSRASGRNLPGFEATRKEVQAAIDAADWLQPTDTIMLDLFCSELNAHRYTARVLAQMTPVASMKKLNAQRLQIRRGKLLLEIAGQLGFTAASRYRLGLTAVKIQRAKEGAKPVKSSERALAVAKLLQQSGALPPVEAEVVADEAPDIDVTPADLKPAPEEGK
jgi:hypothetical protein